MLKTAIKPISPATLLLGAVLNILGACTQPPASDNETPTRARSESKAEISAKLDAQPQATGVAALAAWLDPATTSAAFSRGDHAMDPYVIATVFALPPRAADLLKTPSRIDAGMEATLGEDKIKGLLGPESLVFTPPAASGHYVLRPLLKPKAEFEALLDAEGLQREEAEGFNVYRSAGAFGWKIVALDEGIVAFIPAQEIGTGLSPLTAGRDMPPAGLEREFTRVLHEKPELFLTLHAGGPMLHLDVSAKIAMTQLGLHTQGSNVMGQVVLQPMGDVDETANALEARSYPEENQQVQALVSAIAFTREADVVIGTLELTPTQLKHLAG